MKIGGKAFPKRGTKRVTLERATGEITILLTAVPLGFTEKMLDWIPQPVPPRRYARDIRGKVLKDKDGRHVREDVPESPEFLKKTRRVDSLLAVALLHEGMKYDPEVSWGTTEPEDDQERMAFYEAIYEELKAANFTTAELQFLCEEISNLSIQKIDDLEDTRESF